jgi:chloramphenicol-sensitive protein RarD
MPAERWAGFALVWLALSMLTWDGLRTARRTAQLRARAAAGAAAGAAGRVPAPGTGPVETPQSADPVEA